MTSLDSNSGAPTSAPRSTILHGDCVKLMATLPPNSVDFILTDPPYLVNCRPRSGQRIANDNGNDWLQPAADGMYRLLKPDALCVSFYGWTHADQFMAAWRNAGFRPVGHITFVKRYASSRGYLRGQHEMAYLLAKGRPPKPKRPISDVIEFAYTGNIMHPTQKPIGALRALIECFTQAGDLVFDPFLGSGSTLIAAAQLGREWLGIECDAAHYRTACNSLRRRPE
jgi:site-specific DNA-methyltransferase (adenine-specific)